jgi:hypothetical protein
VSDPESAGSGLALSTLGTIDAVVLNGGEKMLLVLAFLLVLLFFGLGFALHFLWIIAVVLLVLWLIGFAIGRGESSGSHRFYRW